MEEAYVNSEVKISHPQTFVPEADLDGSSESPVSLHQQRSRTNVNAVKLEPIKVTFTDGGRAIAQPQKGY